MTFTAADYNLTPIMYAFHTLCWLGLVCGAQAESAELRRVSASQRRMGTVFEIVLYASDPQRADRALQSAFARIAELDGAMSDYDPESELSRLSRAAPTAKPVPISLDLVRVLDRSLDLSRRTQGAFDVTVGPLSRLWRRARRRGQLPDAKRLEQARAAVGFRYLELDVANRSARLVQPRMRLDLGGIAKGYAADAALDVLRQNGVDRALVNAGGDIATSGPPPDGPGWRIGIAPLQPRAAPSRFVKLANSAVATSGDAWQFVEIEGRRYSHIIDPRNGLGLTRRSSVTVVAPDGTTADGLASAISVLGPERGLALVEQTAGAEALIIHVEDGQPQVLESAGMNRLTQPANSER